MNEPSSPFLLLTKIYEKESLTRNQYLLIRAKLLDDLQNQDKITTDSLTHYLDAVQNSRPICTKKTRSVVDWVVIGLGFCAAAVAGFIIYGP